jgi:hypothetical protein
MPTGVPMSVPEATMMRLPTIALARPPSAPGGGVICVYSDARESALPPS